jgi:hypothetical protein
MKEKLLGWSQKEHIWRYTKNTGMKITMYLIGAILIVLAGLLLFSLIKSGFGNAKLGDTIGGFIAILLFLFVGWIMIGSVGSDDKYIDTQAKTLNMKVSKNWKAIPFSEISHISSFEKYINNRYNGTVFVYMLNNQTEPNRRQQELSDAIFSKADQEKFYNTISTILEVKK